MNQISDRLTVRRHRLFLERSIQNCSRCSLSGYFVNEISKVFGNGNCYNPDFLLLGMAPSHKSEASKYSEPHRRLPARAFDYNIGAKFRQLLREVGIYERSYITNVIKCCTRGNRAPKTEEKDFCFRWLVKEFNLFFPKAVVTLGSVARSWIDRKTKESQKDNHVFFNGVQVRLFHVYHPNYCFSYHKISRVDYRELFREISRKVK